MKIGYYIHSQGSGHMRRASKIIPYLNCDVVIYTHAKEFYGLDMLDHVTIRNLGNIVRGPQKIENIHLSLHHQEYHNDSFKNRYSQLVNHIVQDNIGYMIIDLDVQVAMLCALMTIPYAYNHLPGTVMEDTPHLHAFAGADHIICPFPKVLDVSDGSLDQKTTYLRYPQTESILDKPGNRILIMSGEGNGGLDVSDIYQIVSRLSDLEFDCIGLVKGDISILPQNIIMHGYTDSHSFIPQASIVIATNGSNIISEMAFYRKKYIAVPEWTYFDEQLTMSKQLSVLGCVRSVNSWSNYNEIIEAVASVKDSNVNARNLTYEGASYQDRANIIDSRVKIFENL